MFIYSSCKKIFMIISALLTVPAVVLAHVPYIEHQDYSEDKPFTVEDSIENSKAMYAWFETGEDIDVYTFEVLAPVRVYANALVPVCPGYEELLPWLAVVGPGLPPPPQEVPFTIPPGYGAIIVENLAPGEPRETFYEPFGGKFYYDGPAFDQEVSQTATWYIYYWEPYKLGGDYVAVLGFREVFTFRDILRGLIITPMIRLDKELHVECPQKKASQAPAIKSDKLTTTWGNLKKGSQNFGVK
ncbi:hypothetical protein FJZ31_29970 [Candidatus Poribacteria bacterium]|nr:hypothetical protein [Candidatus Poribacteria bacterium]